MASMKASATFAVALGPPPHRTLIRGRLGGAWASGHAAAAPPRSEMNARRLTLNIGGVLQPDQDSTWRAARRPWGRAAQPRTSRLYVFRVRPARSIFSNAPELTHDH